jgi:hypothetical protein
MAGMRYYMHMSGAQDMEAVIKQKLACSSKAHEGGVSYKKL